MNAFAKKTQIFIWTVSAFLKKHGLIILAGIFIGLTGFFAIPKVIPYIPKPRGHQRIGLVGNYTVDKLPSEILSLLGEGLTIVAQDGSPLPGLASSWIVDENGLTYTFKLADNLYWYDGKKVKSTEISYKFKDVVEEVVDDKTIKFKLKEPFAPFPIALSTPVFRTGLLGTGPYHVLSVQKNGEYVKTLNLSGPAKDITFRFYSTVSQAKLGFRLGEVDELEDLYLNPFDDSWTKNIKINAGVKKDRFVGLFFNNSDQLLASKYLRQALSYAVPKPNDDSRAVSSISPDSWAYNSEVKTYNFDPENARSLFKKFQNGSTDQVKLKISTSQSFLALAEDIKQSWNKVLGIQTEVEVVNSIPQDYQIFLGIQEIPIDPDQYSLWHSTRQENITRFKDARVDKLLEDGRRLLNKDVRNEKYQDFQRFLLEEAPVAFLSHPKFYHIIRQPLKFL